MSLQVWLPLNGDLQNQGLNNMIFENYKDNAIIDNNGKIGKCYNINGSSSCFIQSNTTQIFPNTVSIAAWIKIPNDETTNNGYLFGLTSDSYTRFMVLFYGTTNTITIYNNTNGTNSAKLSSSTELSRNVWYHIAVTTGNGKTILYINGELDTTASSNITDISAIENYIRIGGRRNGSNTSTSVNRNFYINDLKVYNHTLSAKEVEELAKGLVLHYKLDNKYIEGTTNLLSAANSFPEPSNAGFSSSNTVQGQYWGQTREGSTYTFSGYINNTSNLSIAAVIRAKQASNNEIKIVARGNYIPAGQKGWTVVSTTFSSEYLTSYVGVGLMCSSAQSNLTSLPLVQYLQLEEKDHATPWTLGGTTRLPGQIYDCSGYRNNGTVVGSLTAAAGSPRYGVATNFATSSSDYIQFPHLFSSTAMNNEFTFSCWLYRDYTDATERSIYYGLCRIYLYTNFAPRIAWQLASEDLSYNSSNAWAPTSTTIIPLQEWTHLVFTFQDGKLCCYINGVQFTTTRGNGQFIRGVQGTQGSVGSNWIGKISDVRTYTTALTQDQVLELYNTSGSIDASGNVYARELVEL